MFGLFSLFLGITLVSLCPGPGNGTLTADQFLLGQPELLGFCSQRCTRLVSIADGFAGRGSGILACRCTGSAGAHPLALFLDDNRLGAAARKTLLHGTRTGTCAEGEGLAARGIAFVSVAHKRLSSRLLHRRLSEAPRRSNAFCPVHPALAKGPLT